MYSCVSIHVRTSRCFSCRANSSRHSQSRDMALKPHPWGQKRAFHRWIYRLGLPQCKRQARKQPMEAGSSPMILQCSVVPSGTTHPGELIAADLQHDKPPGGFVLGHRPSSHGHSPLQQQGRLVQRAHHSRAPSSSMWHVSCCQPQLETSLARVKPRSWASGNVIATTAGCL